MELSDLAERISRVEEREKSNTKRIDSLEKQTEAIQTLATNVAVMAEKVDGTGRKVDTLVKDVSEIKSAPGKRWQAVAEKIIVTVVAAIVGFVLARVGLA